MNSKRAVRELRASYVLHLKSGVISGSDNFIKYYWLLKRLKAMGFQTLSQTSPKGSEMGNRRTLTGSLFSSDVLWLQQGYSSMTHDPGR